MQKKERYNITKDKLLQNLKEDTTYQNKVLIILIIILLLIIIVFMTCFLVNIDSKKENSESTIIYGEINETIEYADISNPIAYDNNGNFYGNNYFNLYQNCAKELGEVTSSGNFTYDSEFYYYSLCIEEQHLVVKENISTNEKTIIYRGDEINNILNINGWIYGIKRGVLSDSIIFFSTDGNSIRTKDYNARIASLISDGEKLYYTLDSKPYVYEIDLLLNNVEIITSCDKLIEYPEVLYIKDHVVYYTNFNELYSYNTKTKTKKTITSQISQRYNKPSFLEENIVFIDNTNSLYINNEKYDIEIHALSIIDNMILISQENSLYGIDINERLVYNIVENEFEINSIYVTDDSIIVSNGIKYKKINKEE